MPKNIRERMSSITQDIQNRSRVVRRHPNIDPNDFQNICPRIYANKCLIMCCCSFIWFKHTCEALIRAIFCDSHVVRCVLLVRSPVRRNHGVGWFPKPFGACEHQGVVREAWKATPSASVILVFVAGNDIRLDAD